MRCRSRMGTGPVGEPVDVTDVGEQPGGAGRADAVQGHQVEPRATTSSVSSFLMALIFLSIPSSSMISSTARRRRVFPTRSRGLMVAINARA